MATTLQLTDFFFFFFFACFGRQEMILARNIDCRNIEAIWASSFKIRAKIEIQEHFSVHLTSQTSLWMSCDMVLQSVLISLAFYRRNLVFFFLKSSLEFNSHCGQPKCIGVLVSSQIDQSSCSVLRQRNNNFQANCTVVRLQFFFFFSYGRQHNAKYVS